MNMQESAKTTDCKISSLKGKSTVLFAKVINPSCPSQHNYITVSTLNIINVMKSYPFNHKCCVLARFIAVNHFSRLSNTVKLFPLCFMGQVCI